ncbi:ATP-binding cassette domain-containing protein, partial [Roseibium sp. TrichSKD4]|uniref:ATP-binding cassette domain-containing protein n=1 Tax=Roseibium sp. TrichSKD4 TaxID=744980 RepID=UPI00058D5691
DHQIIFPTVREELAFGLRQQGQSKNEAVDIVDRTLLRFDKSHWRDASISTLSHGQKHLVCIMAITAMAPKLLILDEPFAGLDIPTIAQLKRHLTRFQGRILHISHNPLDLEDASQLLWLEEGRICEVGSRCEVLPAYLSRMQDLGGRDDLAVLAS